MTAATPLSDITVIELGHSVAAPYAAEISPTSARP
jgi:crotonobetainyl-CoA:carnitine CoA-transferase CaiB-like acyl-CoA transferase